MNGHRGIDTTEATEHLKNILNVGKKESEAASKLSAATMSNVEVSSVGSLLLNENSFQAIDLGSEKDGPNVSIYGSDVNIYSSPLDYGSSSGQVIIDNMVDYGWEEKYYTGKLISIHPSGKYLAYVLRPSSSKAGLVRILKTNSDIRYLIKDYKADIKDISFAHSISQVLLGSVDARGELLIHRIVEEDKILLSRLLIRVTRPADTKLSDNHRIIWCPYIPDDTDNTDDNDSPGDDVTTLLVVTHDEKAEIWNVDTIVKEHGTGDITTSQVKNGLQLISEHKLPISAATFSPDGTALAIASLDGDVKFFQVSTLDKDISPRCLHQWTPHNGKPLSSLFFLDNHKNHKPDVQFWRFAITGADNNTEIKLWSCETWTCLQTLRIYPSPADCVAPCLKADLDLSSKYLFLSDIKRKVLLILLLHQDPLTSRAIVCSLSEYAVPFPVLSLAIANVGERTRSLLAKMQTSDDEEKEDIGDIELNEDNMGGYLVKLFWIHTKSLQSCRIIYKPKVESPLHSVDSISSLSQDSFVYKDGLSDVSLDMRDSRSENEVEISLEKDLCGNENISSQAQSCTAASLTSIPSHLANYSGCAEVLLTPEDFTSPSHSNLVSTGGQSPFSHHDQVGSGIRVCDSATRLSESIECLPIEGNGMTRRKSSQHSANSSPSREVAEILSPNSSHQTIKMENASEAELKGEVEALKNNLSSFTKSVTQINSRKQQDYLNEWPQAPDPNKEYRTTANDTRQGITEGETPSLAFDATAHSVLLKLGHSLDDLAVKVTSLTDVLRDQRRDIQSLQDEIRVLRQDHKHVHNNLHTLNSLDSVLTNKFEQSVAQRLVPEYTKLETMIVKRDKEDQQRFEKHVVTLSQTVSAAFDDRLQKTLRHEITNSILPQMSTVLDSLIQQLQSDITQKLGTIDNSLRDNLTKQLKGKPFNDSLAQSVAVCLHQQIQSACKEVFQNNVVPSFDKSCQQLFQQLSEIFKTGTIDYIQYLDKHSQSVCSTLDVAVTNIREEVRKLVANTKVSQTDRNALKDDFNQQLACQQEVLLSSVRQVIQEEMQKMIHEQNVQAMNSRAVTPVPVGNPQVQKSHLMQLIKQNQINEAFQQALSAMDVTLVMYLCESVNADQVFGPSPCPLKQHVLLSLINQLSADLFHKTDVRVRFIEDVIASLDSSNPIIQEHIRNVLDSLQQRIASFLQSNPNHKLFRNFKRISMAIQSFI